MALEQRVAASQKQAQAIRRQVELVLHNYESSSSRSKDHDTARRARDEQRAAQAAKDADRTQANEEEYRRFRAEFDALLAHDENKSEKLDTKGRKAAPAAPSDEVASRAARREGEKHERREARRVGGGGAPT